MKMLVTATSGDDKYPEICGKRDYKSLDEAVAYVFRGLSELYQEKDVPLVLTIGEYAAEMGADMVIEIYDDYRE